MKKKRISLEDVTLVVFDEAHRAVGDYAYVYIGKTYQRQGANQRVLALTASPSSERKKIEKNRRKKSAFFIFRLLPVYLLRALWTGRKTRYFQKASCKELGTDENN